MTGSVLSDRESSWQAAYVFSHHGVVVSLLPIDRPSYFLSRGQIRPEANLISSKRKTAVVSYRRRGLGISVPEQAGKRKKKKKEEEKKKKRRGRGTRREEHGGPFLGGREFCTASAYRNLRREHRSGRRPQDTSLSPAPLAPARSPRRRAATAPYFSSDLSFSLFFRASSSLRPLPFARYEHCAPLSSPAFFFSPRKWTKLRRPRVFCALPPCSYSCWESLMLDDDIRAIFDFSLKPLEYYTALIF